MINDFHYTVMPFCYQSDADTIFFCGNRATVATKWNKEWP